jgi:hypothetical protein
LNQIEEAEVCAMQTIRSVGVLSAAKIMCAIYGVLGLILLPIFLMAGLVGSPFRGRTGAFGAIGALLLAALFPIFYGAVGFVAGAMGALLYNFFAKRMGGVEVEGHASAILEPHG